MRRSHRSLFGAVLLFAGLVPSLAQAQTVTGNVVDGESGRPLSAVVVSLVDEAGEARVRVLTDGEGAFLLRVPGPGRYGLRAERLGFRPLEVEAFDLGADHEVVRDLALASEPIALEGLEVTGEARCLLRPDEGEELARVWQRVRVALQIEALVREEEALRFQLRHFNRELSADGSRTRNEQEAFERGVARGTFRSAPIGELMSDGWIQVDPSDGAWDYYAPDADALLSPAFEEGHCFTLVRDQDRPGLVGLAFEEVGERSVPGIEGALWVDESAGALRFLTYRYTRLPPLPSSPRVPRLSEEALGGRVEFVELPGGSWIVSRWSIRAPMLRSEDPARLGFGVRDEVVLDGVWEMGSEVMEAQAPGGELLALAPVVERAPPPEEPAPLADAPSLTGILTDSISGEPLAGATVLLQHGQLTTTTDETGAFTFDRLPPNDYHLAFEHPRLVELEAYTGRPVAVEAEVAEGRGTRLEVMVPSVRGLIAALCSGAGEPPGTIVAGTVRTGPGGVALPGAEVRLVWSDAGQEEEHVQEADSDGRFLFCDLPSTGSAHLTAALLGVVSDPLLLEVEDDVVVREVILTPPGTR